MHTAPLTLASLVPAIVRPGPTRRSRSPEPTAARPRRPARHSRTTRATYVQGLSNSGIGGRSHQRTVAPSDDPARAAIREDGFRSCRIPSAAERPQDTVG
ncbi:hypothetical protein GCM10018790_48880 [Kitasatospora xanthocidica]|nr:hypothetical protein GCM10018790_48880 [Kitasatospora xanthocidica]